jgi:hypothetical protein
MYHWSDLAVGKPIAVYGMNLLIRAADSAAKAHFEAHNTPLVVDPTDEKAASLMATQPDGYASSQTS